MPFEHSNKRIAAELGLLAVGGAVVVALGWLALSALMDVAARSVPASAERALGTAMAEIARRSGAPCSSPEVEDLARALAKDAGLAGDGLEVAVLQDDTVNAFALPGGHVFVLSGLLHKAESRDEVAGVIAHELGHVALRHHVRAAVRQLGVGAAAGMLLGDSSGLGAMLAAGAGQLFDLAFSREQEEAADAYAVALTARAGFDPAAVGHLLERMEGPLSPPSLLRTHPSGPDRRRTLEKLAAAHPPAPGGPVAGQALTPEVLHAACAR